MFDFDFIRFMLRCENAYVPLVRGATSRLARNCLKSKSDLWFLVNYVEVFRLNSLSVLLVLGFALSLTISNFFNRVNIFSIVLH